MGAAAAFMASSVILVPGELIKQQLQMGLYDASLLKAARAIYQTSGIPGLYHGYTAVCFRDVPYTVLELSLYEVFKTCTLRIPNRTDQPPNNPMDANNNNHYSELVAAALTGGIAAALTTPLDVIKTKLMVDATYMDASLTQIFETTLEQQGWPGLFSGVLARVSWIMPFVCIYLPLYDTLKEQLLQAQQPSSRSLLPQTMRRDDLSTLTETGPQLEMQLQRSLLTQEQTA